MEKTTKCFGLPNYPKQHVLISMPIACNLAVFFLEPNENRSTPTHSTELRRTQKQSTPRKPLLYLKTQLLYCRIVSQFMRLSTLCCAHPRFGRIAHGVDIDGIQAWAIVFIYYRNFDNFYECYLADWRWWTHLALDGSSTLRCRRPRFKCKSNTAQSIRIDFIISYSCTSKRAQWAAPKMLSMCAPKVYVSFDGNLVQTNAQIMNRAQRTNCIMRPAF